MAGFSVGGQVLRPSDPSAAPFAWRDRLALSLEVDDLVEATDLAVMLAPWFRVVRIGLELFSATGPESIAALAERGFDVFADLKLHDAAPTVGKAARVLGAVGARYLSLHAQGGAAMVAAGVEGLAEGAAAAGLPEPSALGVTVLATDTDAPPHIVPVRVTLAMAAGCHGVVCAAGDLERVAQLAPNALRVVPGVQSGFSGAREPVTLAETLARGAELAVVGRVVTGAADPIAALQSLLVGLGDEASR